VFADPLALHESVYLTWNVNTSVIEIYIDSADAPAVFKSPFFRNFATSRAVSHARKDRRAAARRRIALNENTSLNI